MKRKMILVTGNMRCGTTWMTHALQAIGLDVMHECMGADGTVSWHFSIDHPWYPNLGNNPPKGRTAHVGEGRRSDYRFDYVVHMVREPLKTIGSMVSIMQRQEQVWLHEAGVLDIQAKPKLLRMMQAWYEINARVEEDADLRISLERLEARDWAALMRLIGRKGTAMPDIPVKNASRGIFKAKIVTWEDLRVLDEGLTKDIKKMARRYGY